MQDNQYDIKVWLASKLAASPRGTGTQLANALKVTPTMVTRMKPDSKEPRKIAPFELEGIARFFQELPPGYEGMTRWLSEDENAAPEPPAKRPPPNASFPPRWQAFSGDVSIPLRGQISAGPNGRFIMNGQDIARVFCPPGLEGVEGAYAVQIQGASGEPRFYHGETAWANPHARFRKGDDVIVQILGDIEDDEVSSYIKRYENQSSEVLRLYQYNPGPGEAHELEFPMEKVFSIHKVVFHAML
ncbi:MULTISPECIES: S24 family peptidase [Rhizobium/Agrobacterium group]|uniref:S24 family peptidase n=1 Tax=Rhizobium/Agrobacterium group TaxID=227290 RepID=UPI00230060AC|nr:MULTISPECIES: helix-turn-helix transcriptional regulator [Rhizobium/Agrobacterium group]MDA5633397.1 helix-turn-helix transcriptional regulator [Agrobacterium sp. ST15.16.024]MDF1889041.1 helix-turn-helix transcriptional regulator [Rhizobium rhizogenes]